jgi:lipid-A-disaccharide synthase-like uncharacterized protein
MMVDLWHNVGGYFYDVFVTKLNWWAWVGMFAQLMFSVRFLVQWIASERVGHSVVPASFWTFSIIGGIMLFAYALLQRDPVFIIGQGAGVAIYLRNLSFIMRDRKAANGAQVLQKR